MTDEAVILLALVGVLVYLDAKKTKVEATNEAAYEVGQGLVQGLANQINAWTGGMP